MLDATYFDVEFTKHGKLYNQNAIERVLEVLPRMTDLIVVSHGWNNDKADARSLYDRLFENMGTVMSRLPVPGLEHRVFGVLRLYWPSKKFADSDLIPGGGAATAQAQSDDALFTILEELKSDPERLGEDGQEPHRTETINRAEALVPQLEASEEARRDFVELLRSLLDRSEAHPDDASEEFFILEPEQIFRELSDGAIAPVPAGMGGAAVIGGFGEAAGFGDRLRGIRAAARRIANYVTYYQMKERAGTVGRSGLGPVMRSLRDRNPDVRLHLVGHSFGARLVTVAGHTLPARTPAVTMTLLQGAYSHNGLAQNFDGNHDGQFRALVTERRVSGPIIITHTKNDRAVGIAYPLASRIARQRASALGDANDPYGGMGRNGAQHTPEALGLGRAMQEVGAPYTFQVGGIHNLLADRFIEGHNDVTGPQIAYAILKLIAAEA